MNAEANRIYAFGPYRLNPGERLLLRDGLPLALQPKAFELLLILVKRHGQLLTKDELMRIVWPDSVVEEVNLANNVSILRKMLADHGQQFIETVPRHGYRFVAPVEEEVEETLEEGSEAEARTEELTEAVSTEGSSAPENGRLSHHAGRSQRLTRMIALAAIVLCLALAGAVIPRLSGRRPATPSRSLRSIAVLPFKPIIAGERDELLELGMADALITKLSGIAQLVVRPTSAVRKYASAEQDPLAAGRELGVELVLEGSLQKSGDRVRVTMRLLRVADGAAEWTATLEERQADLFRVQDSISREVAGSLSLKLTGEQQSQMARRGTRNTDAFRLYVRARYFGRQETIEGLRKAVDSLTRAIALDPNYAPAYATLSGAWLSAAAEEALRLDDQLAEAHNRLGWVKMNYDWDWAGAERELKRAIDLEPTDAGYHTDYAWFLSGVEGRHEEALSEVQLARELNPVTLPGAVSLYYARLYDQVIVESRQELVINQGAMLQWLGLAYEQRGKYQEAIAAFQKARQIDDTPDWRAYLGHSHALSGARAEAVRMLDELKALTRQKYVSPFFIALVYIGLDQRDQAFEWLERAYHQRSYWLIGLRTDPRLDRLRSDPRFTDLMRRVGHIQ